jgi:hypothetical protein
MNALQLSKKQADKIIKAADADIILLREKLNNSKGFQRNIYRGQIENRKAIKATLSKS